MSSLSARMKKIQLKMKALECSQGFSHYKCMGIFPDAQGQLILQSMVGSGQILYSSKTLWLSLLTAKIKKIRSKNEGARVVTTLYINFSDAQGQITLESVVVSGRNLNSSKLLCMSSLPARMRIESKIKELECLQDFSHYKSMGIFPDAQGELTPQFLVRSRRISNSSEMLWMLWMCSLPASMKKIRLKVKVLECLQDFPVGCHGNQSSNPIGQNLMLPFPHPNDASDKIGYD